MKSGARLSLTHRNHSWLCHLPGKKRAKQVSVMGWQAFGHALSFKFSFEFKLLFEFYAV
jgi:hypothetical protein